MKKKIPEDEEIHLDQACDSEPEEDNSSDWNGK